MKDWNKLTIEELAALTDKQVEFYKKLMYAQEGIVFPEKPNEVEAINIPKDLTVYYINNVGNCYSGICFTSLEEAQKVVELLRQCKTLGHIENKSDKYYEIGTPFDYYGNHYDFNITTDEVYSKEKYNKVQETLATYKKLNEQYRKDKAAYEKASTAAIEVTEEFTNKLNEAKETMQHRNKMAYKFYCDYLPLADGNKTVAMNFLKKAYTISDEDIAYINKHESDYKTKE